MASGSATAGNAVPGHAPGLPADQVKPGRILFMDRTRAFARARWHSAAVRTLRILTPLAAVGVAAIYMTQLVTVSRIGAAVDRARPGATINRELTMDRPRYEGVSKDGGKFLITAVTALPDLTNTNRLKLNQITGELTDVRRQRTDITAGRGLYDTKTNQLELSEGITVATPAGMKADLESATINTKNGTLQSDRPARVSGPQGTIRSDKLEIDQKAKRVGFVGGVEANLTPPQRSSDEAAALAALPKSTGPMSVIGGTGAPVNVTANRLDIDDTGKTAVFTGAVRASQSPAASPAAAVQPGLAAIAEASTIEAERLEIAYAGQPAAAQPTAAQFDPGTPETPKPPAQAGAAKIERIIVPVPLVMTQPGGTRLTGNSAEFDAIGEVAVIAGAVQVTSGPDRRATGERVEFNQRADTILMTGNVIVTQAANEIRGRRLFLDRKAGRTEVSTPAEAGLAKGRMFARLSQATAGQPSAAQTAKKAAAPVAQALGNAADDAGFGLTTFRTDPNAPVEIEADRLVVEDAKKEAVFTGEVRAAQGDFQIRSADMKATYTGETGLVADPAAAARPGKTQAQTQLNKLEARGKVVVSSKANQQVTGDWAIFDMKSNTATVGGNEVVITQGPNIVKGNKLLIDMTTGQSVMTREAPRVATSDTTANGLQIAPSRPGRSSLTLYPSTLEKKPSEPGKVGDPGKAGDPSKPSDPSKAGDPGAKPVQVKPPASAKPSSSSWGATSEPAIPR